MAEMVQLTYLSFYTQRGHQVQKHVEIPGFSEEGLACLQGSDPLNCSRAKLELFQGQEHPW